MVEPGIAEQPAERHEIAGLSAPESIRTSKAGRGRQRRRAGTYGIGWGQQLALRQRLWRGVQWRWFARVVPLLCTAVGTAQRVVDCTTSPTGALDVTETQCQPPRANLNPDVRYFKVCRPGS